MDIQPRPIAETVSAPRPNLRLCMSPPLAGILLHGHGAGARYNSAVRRIEAVVFDIGGVVQESPLHAIARYERDHGLLPDAVNRAVAAAGDAGAWARLERGELTRAAFLDDLGMNLNPARALGMVTIKVDAPDRALRELSALLGVDL